MAKRFSGLGACCLLLGCHHSGAWQTVWRGLERSSFRMAGIVTTVGERAYSLTAAGLLTHVRHGEIEASV
jgi:hypothetical protein